MLGSPVIHRGKLKIPSVWCDSAEATGAWHSKPRSKFSHGMPKAEHMYRSHILHNELHSYGNEADALGIQQAALGSPIPFTVLTQKIVMDLDQ